MSWICMDLMSGCTAVFGQSWGLARVGGRVGSGKRTNREPSIRLKQSSVTTSSSAPRMSQILLAIHLYRTRQLACGQPDLALGMGRRRADAHFFMTWRLTFCISTFWLNSGGNLVARKSFWSTVAAMFAQGRTRTGASLAV